MNFADISHFFIEIPVGYDQGGSVRKF